MVTIFVSVTVAWTNGAITFYGTLWGQANRKWVCEGTAEVRQIKTYSLKGTHIIFIVRCLVIDLVLFSAQAMLPPALLNVCGPCDRLGRLHCVEGSHGIGWFCLSGFILHVLLENTVQTIDLRKLLSLSKLVKCVLGHIIPS